MSATGINMEYGWYMILVQPQVIIYPIGRRNCLVIVTVGDKGAGSFFGYLFSLENSVSSSAEASLPKDYREILCEYRIYPW